MTLLKPLIHRRHFMGLGALGLSSLTAPALLQASGASGPAKNVLVIFEQGGMSQKDTWDPKPEAAVEHKSPFGTIQTNVPGVYFTTLMEKTAKIADKLTIVRCMTQPTPGIGNSHPKGSQYVYSGHAPGGPVEMPDMGSVVSRLMRTDSKHLPPYIMVPGTNEQSELTRVGFLPPAYTVFKTGGNLSDPEWSVPNLGLIGINDERFRKRTGLLRALDIGIPNASRGKGAEAMKSLQAQATDMLTNPLTRKAFRFTDEPEIVRERYGSGMRGHCYLMGRKLIEAGVRFVTVDVREPQQTWREGRKVDFPGGSNMNWDHHDGIYSDSHTNGIEGGGAGEGRYGIHTWPMMGSFDQAFSALIEDMDQRGLLDETLVVFATEFGRTPKINKTLGRDHWTHAFSFAFAGAGVPGGQVVGATDKDGGYIATSNAYTVEDYCATVYTKLGLDLHEPIYTPDDRPIFLCKDGEPIPEVF